MYLITAVLFAFAYANYFTVDLKNSSAEELDYNELKKRFGEMSLLVSLIPYTGPANSVERSLHANQPA